MIQRRIIVFANAAVVSPLYDFEASKRTFATAQWKCAI
jgi:hypothetical protein